MFCTGTAVEMQITSFLSSGIILKIEGELCERREHKTTHQRWIDGIPLESGHHEDRAQHDLSAPKRLAERLFMCLSSADNTQDNSLDCLKLAPQDILPLSDVVTTESGTFRVIFVNSC